MDYTNVEARNRYLVAVSYLEAVEIVIESPEHATDRMLLLLYPTNLLASFALELLFKAGLLATGSPSSAVRRRSHDLIALFEDAKAAGLENVEGLENVVKRFAPQHRDLTYRYREDGASVYVTAWEDCLPILHELATAVHGLIFERS